MPHRIYKTDSAPIPVDPAKMEAFKGLDASFEVRPCTSEADVIMRCHNADGLIVMNEPITRHVMKSLPRLKIIARPGVGVDSVDVEAATDLGIQVTNVPDGNYAEVAIHALTLMLNGIRKIKDFDAEIRAHGWNGHGIGRNIRRPSALKLGILGYGRSGQKLAEIAAPLGFSIHVHGSHRIADPLGKTPVQEMELEELLSTSDVISLHIPLTEQTRNLIDKKKLGQFKKGSFLVNVARGGIIDEAALAEAVGSGHLAGAALDVFAQEPLQPSSPLRDQPNILLTPHVAYLSADALEEVSTKAYTDIARLLKGQQAINPVNNPRTNPCRWRHEDAR